MTTELEKKGVREVVIPLAGVPGDEAARGVDWLRHAVGSEPGLLGAEVDEAGGTVRLKYDPTALSLVRVGRVTGGLGPHLGRRFECCVLRVGELGRASSGLVRCLAGTPGVERTAVCPASGTVCVEFDPEGSSRGVIESRVAGAGYQTRTRAKDRETLRQSHEDDARAGTRMVARTSACFALALLGWFLGRYRLAPHWLTVGLFLGAYAAGGLDSARRAFRELRHGSLNVDVLMILAAAGAAAVDAWAEGAVLLFLFSLSNTLEHLILGRTRRAIDALLDLTPEEAVVLRDGVEVRVAVAELRVGDLVLVRPGERIAADGFIRSGHTAVDQSAMTGESVPVERSVGDQVYAATLNGQGAIEVEVSQVAGDTALARVVRLVEEAQSEKAPSQRFTEWFGARYAPAVVLLALVVMAVPPLLGREAFATSFYRAMTVLVVASPCAVVISIPAAILAAIAGAARRGILFKGGVHLENTAALRAVAFDKTGTLTIGRPRLVRLLPVEGVTPEELLRLAATAESRSEHPLSKAVVDAAKERGLELGVVEEPEALVGRGLKARVDGRWILVGKPVLFEELGHALPPALGAESGQLAGEGQTVVFVSDESRVLGALAVADTVRPSAASAVRTLFDVGIEHVIMLTGDQPAVAKAIAGGFGMSYEASLMPGDKLDVIRRLRETYVGVAMVGDGINDAPALAAATVGVTLGIGGTDVALETADVVLMADDLNQLPDAIALARRAKAIIKQNLVFALGMMLFLLGVTFLGRLPLPLAVLGHEGSTVLVILNAVRLLRGK